MLLVLVVGSTLCNQRRVFLGTDVSRCSYTVDYSFKSLSRDAKWCFDASWGFRLFSSRVFILMFIHLGVTLRCELLEKQTSRWRKIPLNSKYLSIIFESKLTTSTLRVRIPFYNQYILFKICHECGAQLGCGRLAIMWGARSAWPCAKLMSIHWSQP